MILCMVITASSKFGIKYSISFASPKDERSILNTRFQIQELVLCTPSKSKNSFSCQNWRSKGSTFLYLTQPYWYSWMIGAFSKSRNKKGIKTHADKFKIMCAQEKKLCSKSFKFQNQGKHCLCVFFHLQYVCT